MNMYGAFEEGTWAARQGHLEQQPWLDGDGDGVINEPEDAFIAAQRILACAPVTPGTNWPPYITDFKIVNRTGTYGDIRVKVEDDQSVRGVWVVVYPPSYQVPQSGDELIAEPQPFILPAEGNGWYSGKYPQFDEPGEYRLVVHAEDNEALRSRPQELVLKTGWEISMPVILR